MKQIFKKLAGKSVTLDHVCEVGVYLPETSNIADFIKDRTRATLVEANPELVEKIETYFKGCNARIYPYAVWDWNGKIKLAKAKASTFVSDLSSSPAIVNDGYEASKDSVIEVECRKFSELDDGCIDLLSVDIEGGEWYVIKHMTSRPKIISIETHFKAYTNPFINEISKWIKEENYRVWYKNKSDTVFVRKDVFDLSMLDRILLVMQEIRISIKKLRNQIKKQLRKGP